MCRRGIEDDLRHEGIEIGPDAAFPTPGLLQNRHRGIVGLQIPRRRHLAAELVADRRQRGGDVGDPAAQRRPREVEVLALKDPLEPVQGQMVEIFRDHHVRE